jgi:hypothetical protein
LALSPEPHASPDHRPGAAAAADVWLLRETAITTGSRAAARLTCGRRRNPRPDLHGCRWLSLAVMDRIRSCDGPQTAPHALYPARRPARCGAATPDRALIINRST